MEDKIINQRIRDSKLFVIDETGTKLGVISRNEALDLASDRGLDLMLVTPANKTNNGVAIAKILDYGKFNYQQKMKEKESRKKQATIKFKEVKVRPQIGDHDLL